MILLPECTLRTSLIQNHQVRYGYIAGICNLPVPASGAAGCGMIGWLYC